MIELPEARLDGKYSFESVVNRRRSVREFSGSSISLNQVSQLLWAAQGITNPNGYRTAPSAGALYPLEIYLVVGAVTNLNPGIYRYNPQQHNLEQTAEGYKLTDLAKSAFGQSWIAKGSVVLVISAIYERTTHKYGSARGRRYVHMEAGHAAQNVLLQAVSLDLKTLVVGAFDGDSIKNVLRLRPEEQPLYLIPIGQS